MMFILQKAFQLTTPCLLLNKCDIRSNSQFPSVRHMLSLQALVSQLEFEILLSGIKERVVAQQELVPHITVDNKTVVQV